MAASRGVRFMAELFALLGTLSLVHGQPNVYLSLGVTIITNNTEVLITAIGQVDPTSLTCHTDLTTCCRSSDGTIGGAGEWYYPDWTKVPPASATQVDFARVRNAPRVVRLHRRIPPAAISPTGLYCCVIPTTVGEQTFCADLEYDSSVVMCPTLSVLDNGMISYSPTNSPTSVGTMATSQCNVGYILIGVATRTCGSNGVWSGEKPICEPVCSDLPSIQNGVILYSPSSTTNARPVGTMATYSCTMGYSLVRDGVRTCQNDRQWSGSPPSCQITTAATSPTTVTTVTASASTEPPTVVMCPTLSVLDNGMISYFPANSLTSVGTFVVYQCNVGYSLNGFTTRTCASHGVWSGEKPTCEAVDCGAPPSISNGSPGTPTKTTFEGTVTYTCNNGYFLEGLFEISCLANGQWDTTPTCVYFSLSSTNYISNNSEILLSSVGEGPGNYLTCHTDLSSCCRGSDTEVDGGVGAWHYPNGSVIPPAGGGEIYSNRDAAMVIRMNRRPGVAGSTGLYCCVIPTSTGTDVSCVNLVAPISCSPSSQSDNTGAIVGGVVILGLILAVTAVIIAYLVLKQRRMRGVDLKRDIPDIPLSALGQSSPSQTYETVDATYEEIDKPRPLKGNFDFNQCEAYVTPNPSSRREGVVNVEGSGTTTEEIRAGNTTHETV